MRSSTFHITILLLFFSIVANAQKEFTLTINAIDDPINVFKKVNYKTKFGDSLSLVKELNNVVTTLHLKSFLLASCRKVEWNSKSVNCVLSIGDAFEWAILKKGNLDDELIRKVDFKEKIFRGSKFKFNEVAKLEEKILDEAENNGYPFSSIKLDSVLVENNTINASIKFIAGPKIVFDSVGIIGSASINRKFIRNYLQIKKEDIFDQSKIDRIEPLLTRLNIAQIKRKPEIRFINGRASIYLFLDAKKTTSIDGIAGLQQDKIDQEKLLLTGEFNLNLRNILQSGKRAEIHWKKLNRGSSSLESVYSQPAIFGSPVEFNTSFNFLDQDSTYLTINPKIGFKYSFQRLGTIGFFYELNDTRLQDTSIFAGATTLPPFADSKLKSYGVSYDWNNLDNYFSPRKGIMFEVESSVGSKTIDVVLDEKLYEGVDLKSIQLQGNGKIENHISIKKNFTFVQRVMGAWIENERLFYNDLYRIGGINSLRGFRDYSFFASKYIIETAEFRVFTEESSYFMIFVDYGQYVTEIEGAFERNFPLGFGGGLSFSTKVGIFNMVYALGKESGGRINFNNSVVDFGLTSRF